MQFMKVGLLIPLCLVLVACPYRSAVWVEPGSTAEHMVFVLGKADNHPEPPLQLYYFGVYPCPFDDESWGQPEQAVWLIEEAGNASVPRRVVYGVDPPGYKTVRGPAPLTPGCYRARDSGNGFVEFEVLEAGGVAAKRG